MNSLARRGRSITVCVIAAVTVVIACLVFFGFKDWGIRGDCAPQQIDGQCGMSTAFGTLFGYIGGTAVCAAGLFFGFRRWDKPLEEEAFRLRRSARIFLFDPSGNILLIRFVAQREDGPFVFWVTPGGEIEPGEEPRAAAERELFEELGLRVPLLGPVHEESGGAYTHLGETVRNFDVFFVAECDRDAPKLAGVTDDEIALMQEARWWSIAELEETADHVFPAAIATIAAQAWCWKES